MHGRQTELITFNLVRPPRLAVSFTSNKVAASPDCAGFPTLVETRVLVESFQAMARKKLIANLDPWIASASVSLIASFASGIIRDKAAVRAAITEPWSKGQTEGQITKLKLVKRQMYGRAKIDLLQARLIGAI